MEADSQARIRGCLLGGAVGDALGAPVEFMSIEDIRRAYGPAGIVELPPGAEFTDDTQMTLFTAEGLIRAVHRYTTKGIASPPGMIRLAYLRWLATQGEARREDEQHLHGWLLDRPELQRRRAPGMTCLSALRQGGDGRVDRPVNDSKGCGGVMRVAPVGLIEADDPFALAADAAAITHGHPSGYLSAGAFAVMVAQLHGGAPLEQAVGEALGRLRQENGHEEVADALAEARRAAQIAPATPETVATLGQGWVAEEALAIALFAALKATDFRSGLVLAVNHSGDSDSTGAIAGNLLGAALGEAAIPGSWRQALDAAELVATVADDLALARDVHTDEWPPDLAARYPPV